MLPVDMLPVDKGIMTTDLSLDPSELAQIVESVFESMLNLEAHECGQPWFPSADRLTAAVHLAGDWTGAVLIECNSRLANGLAAHFLAISPTGIGEDVVRDVLGELVNVVGGNLKSVLPRGVHLSMPSVVRGEDYNLRVCGAKLRERLAFRCEEGPFWVTVLTTS